MLSQLVRAGPFMESVSLPRGRYRLHVMPTSTGYDIRSRGVYDFHGQHRGRTPFAIIQHTISGAGNLMRDRHRHALGPGDTMVVLIPDNHRYWLEEGESWSFFWIAMHGGEALRVCRNVVAAAGSVLRLQPATIDLLAAAGLGIANNRRLGAGAVSALAYSALMSLHDDVLGPSTANPAVSANDAIRSTPDYVRTHLDQPLNIATLAARAGLSRSHFTRAFFRLEGLTPAEFVMHERMRRAAHLIAEGRQVVQVSKECGFRDANYFSKAFRRAFGLSPTEYRTNGMYVTKAQGT